MTNHTTFIVFHSGLHEEQYLGSEGLFHYAKVGDLPAKVQNPKISDRILFADSLSGFEPMGKHWAESEFLFAIYRTISKYPTSFNTDWLGFLQYDNHIVSGDKKLSDLIHNVLPNLGDEVVSLSPIDMRYEIDVNHITMDFTNPQKIQGDPRCYFPMIADYNKFYGTNKTYGEFVQSDTLALCSSFIMRRERFIEMMKFCSWAIERHDLNLFDPLRKHRFAGGLMERYYAMWIALSKLPLNKFGLGSLPRL